MTFLEIDRGIDKKFTFGPLTGTQNRNESASPRVVKDLPAKSGLAAPFELSLRIVPPLTVPAYSSWLPSLNRVSPRAAVSEDLTRWREGRRPPEIKTASRRLPYVHKAKCCLLVWALGAPHAELKSVSPRAVVSELELQ